MSGRFSFHIQIWAENIKYWRWIKTEQVTRELGIKRQELRMIKNLELSEISKNIQSHPITAYYSKSRNFCFIWSLVNFDTFNSLEFLDALGINKLDAKKRFWKLGQNNRSWKKDKTIDFEKRTKPPIVKTGQNRRFVIILIVSFFSLCKDEKSSWRSKHLGIIIYNEQTFVPDRQNKFSVCTTQFKDPFKFLATKSLSSRWIKQVSECSGWLDELTRFLHSASSSWLHGRNKITEFHLLAYCLDIFTCWLRFFGNDVRNNFDSFEKPRHDPLSPFYIGLPGKLPLY